MVEIIITEKQAECLKDILAQLEKTHTNTESKNSNIVYDNVYRSHLCSLIIHTREHLKKPNLPKANREAYEKILEHYLEQIKEI